MGNELSMVEPTTSTASSWVILKNLGYIPAFFLGLSLQSYGILAIFMIVDTVTGVIRAGTIHGWRSVTSHAASVGVLSKMCLIGVPILLALAGHGVGMDLTMFAKGTLSILILSELYSILGNVHAIHLGKEVKEFDAINLILSKLRDVLEKMIRTNAEKR